MITRTINKILKSLNNLPAEYKVALARILTGMIEGIDYLNKEKVDKEEGKGLSTNDFTNNLKDKLNHIEDGAQKNVKSDWNAIEGDSVILNKPSLLGYPDSAEYDSISHNIIFKHQGTILPQMTISGANFIKDGMVDNVVIENNNLIITFNTDAGKQPIIIPLSNIFNPNNYYTKTQTDNKFVEKVVGKQLSTEDFTTDLKTKLEHIEPTEQPDWNENDDTKMSYIKNRTHYRELIIPEPIIAYESGEEYYEESIENLLAFLSDGNNVNYVELYAPIYTYIEDEQSKEASFYVSTETDTETGYMKLFLIDNISYAELMYFNNITNPIELRAKLLEIINLICDNTDDGYKFKKSIIINDIIYDIDENELEYIYHKIDKKYLPVVDANLMTSITYSELKSLRDNGQLAPGMQYRITDFVTTVNSSIDYACSAGHQFDIIVTADSTNKLNENARACLHKGDTYFVNGGLEALELKYSLDNDIYKFDWADNVNGKGVIYWMKDKNHNECFYDFKNIQFKRYKIINCKIQDFNNQYFGVSNTNTYSIDNTDFKYFYTFYSITWNREYSSSLRGIIVYSSLNSNDRLRLPNNVFIDICNNTIIKSNSTNNTIIKSQNSIIGDDSDNNIINLTNYSNIYGSNNVLYMSGNVILKNSCNNNSINRSDNIYFISSHGNELFNSIYVVFNINVNHIVFEKQYICNVVVESNNQYINITSTQTASSSNRIQNIKISSGTNVTTTSKIISHDTVNDEFQTVYKNANLREVTIE